MESEIYFKSGKLFTKTLPTPTSSIKGITALLSHGSVASVLGNWY